jgi:hypothetical protein
MEGPRRVFLSHTSELWEFPRGRSFVAAAKQAIVRAGYTVAPAGLTTAPFRDTVEERAYVDGRDSMPAEYWAEQVRGCDVYVGLIGFRYGSPARATRPEVSYAELEFAAATEAGLPRLVFMLDEDAAVPKELFDADVRLRARQQLFRSRLAALRGMTVMVSSPGQLELLLFRALQETRPPAGPAAAGRGGIFLSYRREDSAPYARLLQSEFRERFPDARVFMDLDSIEPGLDFAEVIGEAVASCAVLVALIGRQWATLTDEEGHLRLDDPDDFVRFEVQAALERGVRIIPVLVDGARPLRQQQLPAELRKLARLNALELSYGRYEYDANRLLDLIQRVLTAPAGTGPLA